MLIGLFALQARAADSLVCSITVKQTFFTVDVNGMIYYITPSHEIVRTDSCGAHAITYSNTLYGTPSAIDVVNPLKILVFYKDQQKLVMLDKTMSEIAVMSLNNINGASYLPSLVCRGSGGDHIWLFDELTQTCVRLDESGNKIASSEPWNQLFTDAEIPMWMYALRDHVYVYTNTGQLHVFDAFATAGKTFSLPAMPMDVIRDMFLVNSDSGAILFNIFTGEQFLIPLPLTGKMLRMHNGSMFAGDANGISVFRLP